MERECKQPFGLQEQMCDLQQRTKHRPFIFSPVQLPHSLSCRAFSTGHRGVVENTSSCQMWVCWDWTMCGNCGPGGKGWQRELYKRDSMYCGKTVAYLYHPITTGAFGINNKLPIFLFRYDNLLRILEAFVCVTCSYKSMSVCVAGLGYWSTTTGRLETCHYFASMYPSTSGSHVRFLLCLFLSALGSRGVMEDRGVCHSSHSITRLGHDSSRITHTHTPAHCLSLSLNPPPFSSYCCNGTL